MKRLLLGVATAAIALATSAPAAALTFNFSFAGTGLSGSGVFTTADTANATGGYLITATTGSITVGTTTSTFTGPTTYASADNLLYAFSPIKLSFDGTSVAVSNGASLNLWYSTTGATYRTLSNNTALIPSIALTSFTVTQVTTGVPETATWGMMILGFGMMGAAMRRRSTKVAFA